MCLLSWLTQERNRIVINRAMFVIFLVLESIVLAFIWAVVFGLWVSILFTSKRHISSAAYTISLIKL